MSRYRQSAEARRWRRCWRLFAMTAWLVILPAWATEGDVFHAGVLTDSTSDGYDRNELFFNYRNHRRDFFWPWQEAQTTDLDWGVNVKYLQGSIGAADFTGERALGLIGKRFSPALYVGAWLGVHQLQVSDGSKKAIAAYSANVYLTPRDTFHFQLEDARDYLYAEGVLPAGIREKLIARSSSLGFTWQPIQNIRVLGQSRWREIDDGNTAQRSTLNLLYGISPVSPWIWMGVGGETLSFAEEKNGYWSPTTYSAYGLRFESNFPITKVLSGVVQANLDRIKENKNRGTGSYLTLGMEIKVGSELFVKIDASHVNSLQSGSSWTEDTYTLSLTGSLP